MKKELIRTITVSILAIGFFAGIAFAHTSGATLTQQRTYGNSMMGGNGGMYQGSMYGRGIQQRRMINNGGGIMGGMMGGYHGNWWRNMGCNGMMGGIMMNRMTPEQQQNFMNQTTELRKKMMDLRFDYRNAMLNPNTTPEDLAKIEKQMLELRTKMMDKIQEMQTK